MHRQFTKLTQRFVASLSAVTAEGRLYDIDMALRPSGRSGPVAVSLDAFTRYYSEKAWVWEFMALSRARVMASSRDGFVKILEGRVKSALSAPRADLDFPKDIADMLVRLRAEKPARGPLDVKQCEGGLRDVEFIAQAALLQSRAILPEPRPVSTLDMVSFAKNQGHITSHDYRELCAATEFFQAVIQAFTLTRGSIAGDVSDLAFEHGLNILGLAESDFHAQLHQHSAYVQAAVARLILAH